jgi:hypothetical protein
MGKHLAIEVSRHGASFVALNNAAIEHEQFVMFHLAHANAVKELLDQAFVDHSFLNDAYDDFSLAWNTHQSTLVPNSIFEESNAIDIFQLCFGKEIDKNEIDYNRISEAGVVNIFEIPVWIKYYFVIKFPMIVLQHIGTHVLRSTLDSNAFRLKATLIINQGNFQLSMVMHNQLHFYSFFDAQSAEDVIYHLMFTLQQKEMTAEKGTIELVSGMGQSANFLREVQIGIEKIQALSGFKVNLVADFIPKAQQLCV